MITIKDVYKWYNGEFTDAPHPPTNLTPLQEIEWRERNEQVIKNFQTSFKNKSFVGELLNDAPAILNRIEKNKINATALYIKIKMGDYSFEKEKYEQSTYASNHYNIHDTKDDRYFDTNYDYELGVCYNISYNESLYETVKLIHNNSMVRLEGKILNFSQKRLVNKTFADWQMYTNWYFIELELSKIIVVKPEFLYSNLLNDKHYFYSNHKSCFIATATYGNYDAPEVLVLRQFRDEKLLQTLYGKVFVKFYYFVSPFFATLISKSDLLKKMVRQNLLEPIVKRIQHGNKR